MAGLLETTNKYIKEKVVWYTLYVTYVHQGTWQVFLRQPTNIYKRGKVVKYILWFWQPSLIIGGEGVRWSAAVCRNTQYNELKYKLGSRSKSSKVEMRRSRKRKRERKRDRSHTERCKEGNVDGWRDQVGWIRGKCQEIVATWLRIIRSHAAKNY